MKTDIFRKVALERLSSPEKLDTLTKVTTSKGWLTLFGIGVLLVMALIWSIFGSLHTKVRGQCILVQKDGLNDVSVSAGGRITDISVIEGDHVIRGQTIARIEQPELLEKIRNTEIRLQEMKLQELLAQKYGSQGEDLNNESIAQQLKNLKSQLEMAKRKISLLKDRVISQEILLQQGVITKQKLIGTRMDLAASKLDAENVNNRIKRLKINRLEYEKLVSSEVTSARNRYGEVKSVLEAMLQQLKMSTHITSPYTGKILEVKVDEGQLVDRGTPVVNVESTDKANQELVAYIYLPAAEGKKIHREMIAEITPSTVKREESGFMLGLVRHVSEYPSTSQGMMRIFGNDALVRQLIGNAPPIQITTELKPSGSTLSGYQWSTRQGPPFAIQSGTLCEASVTVKTRRPIELVLPILKRNIGLD